MSNVQVRSARVRSLTSGIVLALVGALLAAPIVQAAPAAAATSEEVDTRSSVVTGSTTPAEQLGSPPLPDKLSELPEGSVAVDPDHAWDGVGTVPVEVRAATEVTVLPDSPEDPATTEAVDPAAADPVPVQVSVEPSNDAETPALILDVDRTSLDSAEPALPSPAPSPTDSDTPAPVERESVDEPTPSSDPTGSPSAEPTDQASDQPSDPTADLSVDGGDAVQVRLSYADFRYAYGGDWGSRLQVWAYPSCFRTSPDLPECSQGILIPSVNDIATQTLTFSTADLDATPPVADESGALGDGTTSEPAPSDSPTPTDGPTDGATDGTASSYRMSAGRSAPLSAELLAPMAGTSGGTTYVVSAGGSGQGGDYGAQPLTSASSWQVGQGSGEFSYSYPFALPPSAVGGTAASLGLAYSSGAVDGMNLAENGQASMSGLGWNLGTGYITRQYVPCSKDGMTGKGDLCWKSTSGGSVMVQYSIVIDGRSTKIVKDAASGTYRLQDDPGWLVGKFSTTSPTASDPDNDDPSNEAFLVKSPDGTRYWFGWGHGSGSVATVPVYGNNAGEPCYKSGDPEGSWCQQGWRWGLDRVIDRHDKEINYTYAKTQNYYSRYGQTSNHQVYDRDGYVTSITYGRSGAGTETSANEAYTGVQLTTRPRCIPALTDPTATCLGADYATNRPSYWPDVPADLLCSSSDTCLNGSPSFFSTVRYDQVNTKRVDGSSVYSVDSYQLRFQLPQSANDNPGNESLWLSSIQRTAAGSSPSNDITLSPTQFDGAWLQNRVDPPYGGSKFIRPRVNSVRNETGGRVDVVYGHDDSRTCTPDYVNITMGGYRHLSERECYPRKINDTWEWWHKYVTTRVAVGDDRLGYRLGSGAGTSGFQFTRMQVFDYEYLGLPGWRYTSSPYSTNADETWDDWRGYGQVRIHRLQVGDDQLVGTPTDVSSRLVTVFRGLAGSKNPHESDGVRHDTVQTSVNLYTDNSWLQGRVAQEATYASDGTTQQTRTSHEYDDYLTADTDSDFDAHFVYQSRQVEVGRAGGSEHTTRWTVDPGTSTHRGQLLGAELSVTDDRATPSNSTDDLVTCTSWRTNTGTGLRVPGSVEKHMSSCNGTLIGQTKNYYDIDSVPSGAGPDPTDGDPTYTVTNADASSTVTVKRTYDGYGRVTSESVPTAAGLAGASGAAATTTTYNPSGDANRLVTSVRTVTPKPGPTYSGATSGFTSTNLLTGGRGVVYQSQDNSNGALTAISRDALGRPVSVWLPGKSTSGTPNFAYDYRDLPGSPGRVTTNTLRTGTTVDTTIAFYDGWGRALQTTVPSQGDTTKRIATATGYDELGRSWLSAPGFEISSATELMAPQVSTLNTYTSTTFDSVDRPVTVTARAIGSTQSITSYQYGPTADRVTFKAPDGTAMNVTRTTLDELYRPVSVNQLSDVNASAGDLPATGSEDGYATYSYTGSGYLDTIQTSKPKDGSMMTYDYNYNWLGQKIYASDPDTGTTRYSYDARGNIETIDDAMDDTTVGIIRNTYDVLGRPTQRDVVAGGIATMAAKWTYDNPSASADGLGRPWKTTSSTNLGSFTSAVDSYDAIGNPLAVTEGYPSALTGELPDVGSLTQVSKQTTFTYNDLNEVTTATYPAVPGLAAMTVTNSYGRGGIFTGMTGGSKTIASVVYDTLNRPSSMLSQGAYLMKRTYAWSADNELTDLAARDLGSDGSTWYDQLGLHYDYDPAGNPIRITGKRRDTAASMPTTKISSWCYTYDALNRLSTAKTGPATGTRYCATPSSQAEIDDTNAVTGATYFLNYDYKFSALSTVTASGGQVATYDYAASGAPHAVRNITGTSATGLPNLGSLNTTSTYDAAGRATSWLANGAASNPGDKLSYKYDAQGRLVTVDDQTATGGTTKDIDNAYDADGIRVARRTGDTATGVAASTTVYVAGTEITKIGTNNATSRRIFTTPKGTPVAMQATSGSSSAWAWLFADPQGTVRMSRHDGSGAVSQYTYFPFGDLISTPTSLKGERGFLGKPLDPDGSVRLDHRSYDGGLNVLTTPDPLMTPTDPQNLNAYAYSRNNPVAFSDPSGLNFIENNSTDADILGYISHMLDGPQSDYSRPHEDGGDGLLSGLRQKIAHAWNSSGPMQLSWCFGGPRGCTSSHTSLKEEARYASQGALEGTGVPSLVRCAGNVGLNWDCGTVATVGIAGVVARAARAIRLAVLAREGAQAANAVRSAAPSTFVRTEALSGRASARNVRELAESMRTNGWQGAPIDVVEIQGHRIVVDGHHRLAAARIAGIDVPYQVVDPATVIGRGQWSSIDDILRDTYSVGPDRLR